MGDLHCDPVSDESVALMKGWIDNCQRCHQLCGLKPQQVGRPKRLLRCLSDGSVRLVETQSCTQRCDYIALSYCWGDGTAVKKTSEKMLKCRQSGLLAEDLPPLYREVVAVARGLNIGYLWIDAVCMIQHSEKDKEEEMMKMGGIYRGALVVVVAGTAKSPLDSLLRVKPQAGQSNTWRTASLIRYEGMDLDVKFRKRAKVAHLFPDATDDTPIAKRAWCFQERLMANRCLVFCDDEVVWECRSCCLCECGGEQEHFSVPDVAEWRRMMPRYEQMLLPLAEQEPLQLDGTLKYFADAEAAYSFWKTAVNNYSGRALTLKAGRLPAISAVASTVAGATGDDYLAGLWRNDLLGGLCWVTIPERDSRPHQEYIAPTWSWASHPGMVRYDGFKRHWRVSDNQATAVNNAWTALNGQDPYGPVSDGVIVLSGVHCDIEMTIKKGHATLLDFGHGEVEEVCITCLAGEAAEHPANQPSSLFQELDFIPVEPDAVLILTPSRRKKEEAYERLGIFLVSFQVPKMRKTIQPSRITLV